jgi:hypothetical protein
MINQEDKDLQMENMVALQEDRLEGLIVVLALIVMVKTKEGKADMEMASTEITEIKAKMDLLIVVLIKTVA